MSSADRLCFVESMFVKMNFVYSQRSTRWECQREIVEAETRFLPFPMVVRSKAWGLRPFACWDCGFQSRRRHGCLSLVSVVFTGCRSLRQADRSPRGVIPNVLCLSVISKLQQWAGLGPSRSVGPRKKKRNKALLNPLYSFCNLRLWTFLRRRKWRKCKHGQDRRHYTNMSEDNTDKADLLVFTIKS
jgi:hypothetical protein